MSLSLIIILILLSPILLPIFFIIIAVLGAYIAILISAMTIPFTYTWNIIIESKYIRLLRRKLGVILGVYRKGD